MFAHYGYAATAAAAALVLATAIGCGGSDDRADEFVYTPVPYFMAEHPPGTEVPLAEDLDEGFRYRVDWVIAEVRESHVDSFTEWAHSHDFQTTIGPNVPGRPAVSVDVLVPAGSAPAARELIAHQPGVEDAHLYYYGEAGENVD